MEFSSAPRLGINISTDCGVTLLKLAIKLIDVVNKSLIVRNCFKIYDWEVL